MEKKNISIVTQTWKKEKKKKNKPMCAQEWRPRRQWAPEKPLCELLRGFTLIINQGASSSVKPLSSISEQKQYSASQRGPADQYLGSSCKVTQRCERYGCSKMTITACLGRISPFAKWHLVKLNFFFSSPFFLLINEATWVWPLWSFVADDHAWYKGACI